MRDDWRDAGLAHLLAVSGQNVMLLMALALPLLVARRARAARTRHRASAPGGALRAAGGSGPVAAARGRDGRRRDRGDDAVATVVALVRAAARGRGHACPEPARGGDPGWQLSFVAVAGILVAGRPLAARLRRTAEELRPAEPRRAPGAGGLSALAARATVSARASRSRLRPRSPRRRCWPTTSARFRLRACRRTCSRFRRWRPPCGSGWSRPRWAWPPRCCPAPTRLAEALGPLTRLPIGYLDGLAERCATLPGRAARLPLTPRRRWCRRTRRCGARVRPATGAPSGRATARRTRGAARGLGAPRGGRSSSPPPGAESALASRRGHCARRRRARARRGRRARHAGAARTRSPFASSTSARATPP